MVCRGIRLGAQVANVCSGERHGEESGSDQERQSLGEFRGRSTFVFTKSTTVCLLHIFVKVNA